MSRERLSVTRIGLDEANAFVAEHHRHHQPVVGHLFSIGVALGDSIVGVAIVGRPVSRMRDDGITAEVTRLCTDGTKNACSFLYGAAARAAFALGFKRIGTYILNTEPGTSLAASGWRCLGERGGGSWSAPSRPRVDKHPLQSKLLFELESRCGDGDSRKASLPRTLHQPTHGVGCSVGGERGDAGRHAGARRKR